MTESPKRSDGLLVATAVAVLLLVPLGVYVAGYFATSEYETGHVTEGVPGSVSVRVFTYPWQAIVYLPLAGVESLIRGEKVRAIHH